jgi:hypothetical protein
MPSAILLNGGWFRDWYQRTGIIGLVLLHWLYAAECLGASFGPRSGMTKKAAKTGIFGMKIRRHCHESNKMRVRGDFCYAALHFRIASGGRMSIT